MNTDTVFYRQRKSIRLKNFDYSAIGSYFITICIKKPEYILAEIHDEGLKLNSAGKIAAAKFEELANFYQAITVDEYVIMPNHIHAIISIRELSGTNISTIIKGYKSFTVKEITDIMPGFRWQRSFYDNIIRNEKAYYTVRQYIRDNPLKWYEDKELLRDRNDVNMYFNKIIELM